MISSSFTRKTWWETREERECLLFSLKNSSLSSRVRCFRESLLFVLLREKTRRIKRGDVSSSAFVVLCFKVCFFRQKQKKKAGDFFLTGGVFNLRSSTISTPRTKREAKRNESKKKWKDKSISSASRWCAWEEVCMFELSRCLRRNRGFMYSYIF